MTRSRPASARRGRNRTPQVLGVPSGERQNEPEGDGTLWSIFAPAHHRANAPRS